MPETPSERVDPITVSVIQHRLQSIAEEMGEAMLRTSYSQIINSSRDFSTAICDPEGRLIAQAEHVPIHVGALPWAAKAVDDAFRGRIRPGDVYPPQRSLPRRQPSARPHRLRAGVRRASRLAFWSINRSHQSDIGGATHGAYNPGATEIWQEGIRIPPLQLYEEGRLRADVLDLIALNVRHPREFRGDLAAMIGSARVGERRLLELLAEFGPATTEAAIEARARWRRAAGAGGDRELARWRLSGRGRPRRRWPRCNRRHDSRPRSPNAAATSRSTSRDSDPQVTGFINSSLRRTCARRVVVALAYLIDPETPKNDGAFRPL